MLLEDIKKKKELHHIDDKFVKSEIDKYFIRNPNSKKWLDNPRSKKYKQIVKEVRASLRRVYGLFRDKVDYSKSYEEILKSHSSTKERFSIYEKLYSKIFKITGKPSSIIDLGCGVNPFSFPFMKLSKLKYYGYEINTKEVKAINDYFIKNNISGKAYVKDILVAKRFPKADLAFLFKVTDMLDRGKGHKNTEAVLRKLNVKYVVVSFPTKTMSGKRMNFPRRKWFELLCDRLEWDYKIIKFSNELFYVVKV